MKVLVVFLLAVLGCSLAEGRIVPKCDLRNQLTVAIGNLSVAARHRVLSGDYLVAKFVCHAEKSSGFDTSVLKELPAGTLDRDHRGRGQPHHWDNVHNRTFTPPAPEAWMLYGIFQLGNRLACSDGVNATHNVCEIACSQLLDDDISDDISCLLKLFKNTATNGSVPPPINKLMNMLHRLFQPECRKLQVSEYFAGCPPPPTTN